MTLQNSSVCLCTCLCKGR